MILILKKSVQVFVTLRKLYVQNNISLRHMLE